MLDVAHASAPIEQVDVTRAYRRTAWRLVPFLGVLFLLAWIDRVNVGFAKLQMLEDLRFSETVYGLGAGIFFIGYFFFEVPSNLWMERIGARKTLARITILWGLTSMAMVAVRTPAHFYALRFLLGAFEAGFFPGVILYLTYWFPAERRASINGLFMTSFPLAGVLGGPLAGIIMTALDGVAPFRNWQWLFLVEGIPSVVAGIVVILYLPDRPADATWLTAEEKRALTGALEAEGRVVGKHSTLRAAFTSGRMWLCAAIYFCIVAGNATISFWVPSIIRELGVRGPLRIGLISSIPFLCGVIAMVLVGRHSDATGERRWHCAGATTLAAVGLAATATLLGSAPLALCALSLAAVGILGAFPTFWAMPAAFLKGTAAAGGIAAVNSVANLAGFAAPYAIGALKTSTGHLSAGLYVVAALELAATALVLLFIPRSTR